MEEHQAQSKGFVELGAAIACLARRPAGHSLRVSAFQSRTPSLPQPEVDVRESAAPVVVFCLLIACGSDDTTCPTGHQRIGTSCYRPGDAGADGDAGKVDTVQEGCDAPVVVYVDSDGDGYGGPSASVACEVLAGYSKQGGDCADDNPSVHPGADDPCNGVDDDCDPSTTDGWVECGLYACGGDGCFTSCTTHDHCAAGLWCHTATEKCYLKQGAGRSCTANAECASGACHCASKDCKAKICVDAPCDAGCMFVSKDGLRCEPLDDDTADESCNGDRVCYQGQCKVAVGQACTADEECGTGSCVGLVCSSRFGIGDACDSPADCFIGSCVDYICQ